MHYFRRLCLGVLFTLVLPVYAAIPAPELQALNNGAYHAATQLMMYVVLERAVERRQDANAHINALDSRIAVLNDKELLASWQAARAIMLTELYQDNEVSQRVLYAIEDRTTEFVRVIERRMPHDLDRQQRTLYELTRRMQTMMTVYLRNSADPLGGSNYSGINRELDPEKMAKEFTAQLDALAKSQPALAAKIKTKWGFLMPRMTNFSEKSVPFLVDLYGRQIINLLQAASKT
jgi:hypothetical protein